MIGVELRVMGFLLYDYVSTAIHRTKHIELQESTF